jgi:Domain of unknown function (DUF4388)
MKTRGTATDKLADVIQALQLVRKTGLLAVRRDSTGGMSEEGKIAFRDGQVVDAIVGQLRGADAFKKLVMWTRCHFVFESFPPTPPPLAALPSPRAENNGTQWRNPQESTGAYLSVGVVPSRSHYVQGALPDFQRLGLSRIHRQLFLLIDGKRSIQELSPLLGRHPQEVQALLADLESAGLIHQ